MVKDAHIDFDCEFYLQQVVNEGTMNEDRRTTNSVIYHLCTYCESEEKKRCDLSNCPKEKKL